MNVESKINLLKLMLKNQKNSNTQIINFFIILQVSNKEHPHSIRKFGKKYLNTFEDFAGFYLASTS